MAEPWHAEQEVDDGLASALVSAQFPALRGLPVSRFASGWDNTVVRVGADLVFRFPRRSVAVPALEREVAVLPRLARLLPLPVPVPRHVGRPGDGYRWPFWGGRLLPGVELSEAGLDDHQRVPLARDIGVFLRALHAPGIVRRVGGQLPTDPQRRADAGARAAAARTWLSRLDAPVPSAVDALLADGSGTGAPSGDLVVSHGDLHLRHVLVVSGRASGVIDWGDVCLAERAVDLSLAYAAFTGQARAALLDEYGPVDADCERRARVLAVFLCAALAVSADGPSLRAEALAGLGRAVS